MTIQQHDALNSTDDNQFIVFELGSELYAAEIMSVREVTEMIPLKMVPNTVPSFCGVGNLRGQIIGAIDLKIRFGMPDKKEHAGVLMIFDTDSGAIAAKIDRIVSVVTLEEKDIDRKANIVSAIPLEYIVGIGKLRDRLITIVDLRKAMSKTELTAVTNITKLQQNQQVSA